MGFFQSAARRLRCRRYLRRNSGTVTKAGAAAYLPPSFLNVTALKASASSYDRRSYAGCNWKFQLKTGGYLLKLLAVQVPLAATAVTVAY